jgi:FkbM family methyltransferase
MLKRIARKIKRELIKPAAAPVSDSASKLIETGETENLYLTKEGNYYWLNDTSCVDGDIKNTGVWEPNTTHAIKQLVKEGDVVLDIGANIGYDTVIMSKLVGETGKVYAFEPTSHYFDVLNRSLAANKITNTKTFNFGLSDADAELDIYLGQHSATIHDPEGKAVLPKEKIILRTLDKVAEEEKLDRVDFIKLDVDGHEPAVLDGGWKTIDRFSPIILLEISAEHYLEAGVLVWDFYELLKSKGFYIYSEEGMQPLNTKHDFLVKCGNFAYSANIIISKSPLN